MNAEVWSCRLCRSTFERLTVRSDSLYMLASSATLLSAHQIEVARIALPTEAVNLIPLLHVLPPSLKEFYEKEENVVSLQEQHWKLANDCKPKLKIPRRQYVQLMVRMFKLGMISWYEYKQVKIVNSLQCVVKPDNKQRLIFDGRPVNFVFHDPPKVQLPGFHLTAGWVLEDEEKVWFAKLDMDNYYHRLGVPQWMHKYLALPSISKQELCSLDECFSQFKVDELFPVCLSLPMGLSHAVTLAQNAHMAILQQLSIANIINMEVSQNALAWCFMYIDDVIIAVKNKYQIEAQRILKDLVHQFLNCYERVGFKLNQKKLENGVISIQALGCCVDGEKGGVFPIPTKLEELINASFQLLQHEFVKHKWVERLLGIWVWLLLLRRPLFSILQNVYKFLKKVSMSESVSLWISVRREFELLISVSSFLQLSWRRPVDCFFIASDASLLGGAACQVSASASNTISDFQLAEPLDHWDPIFQIKWEFLEHINILEARAAVLAAHNMLELTNRHHHQLTGAELVLPSSERCAAGLKPSTVSAYKKAYVLFEQQMRPVSQKSLDKQIVMYLEKLVAGTRRSTAEKLISAVKHFFPAEAAFLPSAIRFLKQIKRETLLTTKPPMIEDVVVMVVIELIKMGYPTTALAIYIQFDCYLRLSEVCSILAEHVLVSGDSVLGNLPPKVLIILPLTKTGPLQSVDVRLPILQKLLTRVLQIAQPHQRLFPEYSVYTSRLKTALQRLQLADIGYTAHSIRHGAATMDLIKNGYAHLPTILYRGRWESQVGKKYLQMGSALLLNAQLPHKFVEVAKFGRGFIGQMLNGSSFTLQY